MVHLATLGLGKSVVMQKKRRLVHILVIVAIVVALDQGTKYLAIQLLQGRGVISLLNDCLRFLLVENRGGFLSLGASLPEGLRNVIFLIVTSLFLLFFFLYTVFDRESTPLILYSSSAIIGGGVGNLIDRSLRDGAVVDFVNVGIGAVRTGIFNVADMAVLFGCIALFAGLVMTDGRKGG